MANLQTSNNDVPIVQIINTQITTTSTDLAKCFGKRHADVIRRIEKLDCSAEFNERNFALVEYEDGKGETRPMYRITRDGFAFLAMGFKGAKAAYFKEAYINAFNSMEKQKNEQAQLPTPTGKLDDESKYKRLNDIALAMRFTEDSVVIPAKEVTSMVRAIRMYQEQMAQLRTPYWVNRSIERVKECAGRHFCDL